MCPRARGSSAFVGFTSLVFERLEAVDVVCVVQPQLHSDERLTAFDAEHVPGFGFGQEFADGALG